MSLLTPADENECRQALSTAFLQSHPVAVRYPRGSGVGTEILGTDLAEHGPGARPSCCGAAARRKTRSGRADRASPSWPSARCCYPALEAAGKLDATVANMRFVKPLDVALVLELARSARGPGHRRGRLH